MKLSIPRLGLQPKIVAWSFVPAAILLFGVGIFTYLLFQLTVETLMVETNRETTELMGERVWSEIAVLADPLKNVAGASSLLEEDTFRIGELLHRQAEALEIFDGGVVILDRQGWVLASEPQRPFPQEDWSQRPYFPEIVDSHALIFSDIHDDGPEGAPVVALAVPVVDAEGKFAGAVVGMLRIETSGENTLYRLLTRFSTWPEGYSLVGHAQPTATYLVDRKGRVLFHVEAGQVGRRISSSAVQAALRGQSGPIGSGEFRTEEIITYYAPVADTGWGFLAEQQHLEALGFFRPYFELQAVLFVLALVVPAGIVAYGVRQITRPIRQVTAASRQIAAGDLRQEIHVQTGDELEDLADQFNRMSAQLRESYRTLKEREERLALVIQATNDGIWDWDLKTDQVYFSPRWKGMLGYADDELGNTFEEWRRLLHPDDVPRALALIQDYVLGKTPFYELEHRLRHKDGSYRWVLAHGIALSGPEGKPYRMVGSHTDITDRKRMEAQIEARLAFERLITGISTEFINLDAGEIDAGIQRALQAIGEFEGVDRSYVFLISNDGTTMDNVYEWCANGIESFMAKLREIPLDTFPWSAERLKHFQAVHVPSLGALPPEAFAEKQEFKLEGIKSLINVPVAYRGTLVGFLGLDSVRAERTWSDDTIALLRIAGEIFANALEHKREQETLRRSEARFRLLYEESPVGVVVSDDPTQRVNHAAEEMIGYTEDELAHMQPPDYIHPDDVARDEQLHAESEAGLRGRYQIEKRYCHRDGKVVWARYTHTIVRDDSSQPLLHFAVLEDITEQRKAEADLRQANESLERRVQERTRELAALNSIAELVSQSLDLKEIMQDALDQTLQVCGMDVGSAYELEEHSRMLVLTATRGLSEEFTQRMGTRVPLEAALPGQSLSVDRPLVWQVAHDYPEGQARNGVLSEGITSLFTVPLVAKNKIVGALAFGSKARRMLTVDESALLMAIGRQVGIAVENARLYGQAQVAATTAERSRLARELHDSVTQSLYSVMLYAEAAARSLADKETAEAGDFVKELRDTAQDALREMRLLIFELRPPTLEKDGLIGALRTRLSAVEGRGGMKTELQVNDDRLAEQLSLSLQDALYHIVQEALNNIIRHAHAQSTRVALQFSAQTIELEISDDGIGFDPQNADETSGLGLRGMRERVQRIGGSVQITSAPGQGTRVLVSVPHPKADRRPLGGGE